MEEPLKIESREFIVNLTILYHNIPFHIYFTQSKLMNGLLIMMISYVNINVMILGRSCMSASMVTPENTIRSVKWLSMTSAKYLTSMRCRITLSMWCSHIITMSREVYRYELLSSSIVVIDITDSRVQCFHRFIHISHCSGIFARKFHLPKDQLSLYELE